MLEAEFAVLCNNNNKITGREKSYFINFESKSVLIKKGFNLKNTLLLAVEAT